MFLKTLSGIVIFEPEITSEGKFERNSSIFKFFNTFTSRGYIISFISIVKVIFKSILNKISNFYIFIILHVIFDKK